MGLDMYLTAERFMWTEDDSPKQEQLEKIFEQTQYPADTVSFKVGYWRKANAIHQWFVKNVQDGKDNCEQHSVSDEKLQDLLTVVNQAIKTEHKSDILPTQEGFFFGSTNYDEGYDDDLKKTKEIIEKYLAWSMKSDCELYYRSSW